MENTLRSDVTPLSPLTPGPKVRILLRLETKAANKASLDRLDHRWVEEEEEEEASRLSYDARDQVNLTATPLTQVGSVSDIRDACATCERVGVGGRATHPPLSTCTLVRKLSCCPLGDLCDKHSSWLDATTSCCGPVSFCLFKGLSVASIQLPHHPDLASVFWYQILTVEMTRVRAPTSSSYTSPPNSSMSLQASYTRSLKKTPLKPDKRNLPFGPGICFSGFSQSGCVWVRPKLLPGTETERLTSDLQLTRARVPGSWPRTTSSFQSTTSLHADGTEKL